MDRTYLKTAMYELKLDKISTQKMDEITNENVNNSLDYEFGNNRLKQTKCIKNTIIFLEELSELTTELTNYTSKLGVLEEIADVTLCIDTFIKETNIIPNITKEDIEHTENNVIPESNISALATILCVNEIAATQKLLTKYLRDVIELTPDMLKSQLCKLYTSMNKIQEHHGITQEELTTVRYIKSRNFIYKRYHDPHFVPNELLLHCNSNTNVSINFNDETALGEPRAWLSFSDNTSLEICHEEDNLKTPFYSVRLHCSEDDFDNNTYKDTCGVISTNVCNNMNDVAKTVTDIINNNISKNVYPVND